MFVLKYRTDKVLKNANVIEVFSDYAKCLVGYYTNYFKVSDNKDIKKKAGDNLYLVLHYISPSNADEIFKKLIGVEKDSFINGVNEMYTMMVELNIFDLKMNDRLCLCLEKDPVVREIVFFYQKYIKK